MSKNNYLSCFSKSIDLNENNLSLASRTEFNHNLKNKMSILSIICAESYLTSIENNKLLKSGTPK
jgi:hypothetical protein